MIEDVKRNLEFVDNSFEFEKNTFINILYCKAKI